MTNKFILIDTCFLIQLLGRDCEFHNSAVTYFERFAAQDYQFYLSTIAISEFCVRDSYENIPLNFILPLPFNIKHSTTAADLQRILFADRPQGTQRTIIKHDVLMFAQAEQEENIVKFLTADTNARKMYDKIKLNKEVHFEFISILDKTPAEYFGEFDFPNE